MLKTLDMTHLRGDTQRSIPQKFYVSIDKNYILFLKIQIFWPGLASSEGEHPLSNPAIRV